MRVSIERRLSALEERASGDSEAEGHCLSIVWVDVHRTVHEEQRNYFHPAPVPGGTWGALYRVERYEAGKLVKVEHYDRGEVIRVEEMVS
jgi:hypothetical protein